MIMLTMSKSRIKIIYLFLFVGVLTIYALDNIVIRSLVGTSLFIYVLKPLFWSGIALMIFLLPAQRYKSKLRVGHFINSWSFIFAVVYICVQFLAGLVDGLGKSPYDHSLYGIAINIFSIGATLVGREFFRSYIIHSLTKRENYRVFLSVSLFMTLLAFPVEKYLDLQGSESIVKFLAQYFLPEFSKNFLTTYLVFLRGPISSLIFLGTLETFNWMSPILPNLQWITAASVGILTPVFMFTAMQNMYEIESKQCRKEDLKKEGLASFLITILISVGIVWFAVGVFPIYPSVVVTGSMEPMIYPGDVILVKKTRDIKEIEIGDVIHFKRDRIMISHRITEIITKDGIPSYRTKGDNNNSEDIQLVKPEQIKGEIIKVVPKIGWPTMLIKSGKEIPLDEIVF
ncbi:signal peptidase I [Anoxybacterium hadale]